MGEEAYERKQDKFFKNLKKFLNKRQKPRFQQRYNILLKKLQMRKDFSQITEQELEDIGELEYDDEGLFQELGKVN